MKRVHVFCEGQTEEKFVTNVLYDPFAALGIFLNPILFSTSRTQKGGTPSFDSVKRQIVRKCKEDASATVTTMIDFYALPKSFPSRELARGFDSVPGIEEAFQNAICLEGCGNFIANIVVHEFEALLFSEPDVFAIVDGGDGVVRSVREIRESCLSPEHINDSYETAPSRRLSGLFSYDKANFGPLLAARIGLEKMCAECKHFSLWIEKLKALGG